MLFNDLPLEWCQRAGLVEDGVGDAELADIVQQRCAMNELPALRAQAHDPCHVVGHARDPIRVAKGEGRLRIDDIGKGCADVVNLRGCQFALGLGIERQYGLQDELGPALPDSALLGSAFPGSALPGSAFPAVALPRRRPSPPATPGSLATAHPSLRARPPTLTMAGSNQRPDRFCSTRTAASGTAFRRKHVEMLRYGHDARE